MSGDTPSLMSSTYASHIYTPMEDGAWGELLKPLSDNLAGAKLVKAKAPRLLFGGGSSGFVGDNTFGNAAVQNQAFEAQEEERVATRMVKVFIADPDENLPLDKRVLYVGQEKLTDLTDQELFFEIDIKGALDKHNEVRAKTIDKTVKERTEFLEPVKIRNLKMVVVNVATF